MIEDGGQSPPLLAGKSGNPQEVSGAGAARHRAELFSSEALKEGLNPFVLAAPKGTSPTGHIGKKWALVVGISRFQDKSVDQLRFTSDDAQSFSSVLLDPKVGRFPKDNVDVLLNEQATTRNLKVELNWLACNAQPDDPVVIYIATHGSPRSMDTVGANYLVTYDQR